MENELESSRRNLVKQRAKQNNSCVANLENLVWAEDKVDPRLEIKRWNFSKKKKKLTIPGYAEIHGPMLDRYGQFIFFIDQQPIHNIKFSKFFVYMNYIN